ncbi:LCP family protein [Microbacterium sp. KUDC0406]|uniref:LCP family protein n=1 Tax=Microbacterium sp. KUDC0406 TaxID=2909588 RepID=UPI001F4041B0|nr:LCP family protein [Microbacterium sp. KUDC0406]UJP09105.1 LCP family protein [Microbacterium sp. KUDC0406]
MGLRRTRPILRHGPQRTPRAFGQLMSMIGIVLAVVLVSTAGVVAFVVTHLASTAAENSVALEGEQDLPPDIGGYKGGFTVLLTGVDKCEKDIAKLFGDRCSDKEQSGKLNDVTLLVHVSNEPRRVTVVSFPRDMMVRQPACTDDDGAEHAETSRAAMNEAYGRGGLNCVAKTVSELSGQKVTFAASVTFGGVIEITNAIGGVEVCLARSIDDPNTGLQLKAGTHSLKGLQALNFLRTRHGLVGGSDLSRIGNQQQYMSSLVRKTTSAEVLGNVATVLRLATIGLERSQFSDNLDPMRIAQIGLALKDVPPSDYVFLQYPVFDDPSNSSRVVPDEDSADEMWAAIAENRLLQVTHERGDGEGVVDAPGQTPAPTASTAPTPSATGGAVALPPNVKGQSADARTCSNGNGR